MGLGSRQLPPYAVGCSDLCNGRGEEEGDSCREGHGDSQPVLGCGGAAAGRILTDDVDPGALDPKGDCLYPLPTPLVPWPCLLGVLK